jgi:hypothetical protein
MPVGPPSERQSDLTVAHLRERAGMDFVEVMFLESARIFRLPRSHDGFEQLLSNLQTSAAAGRSVRVTFTIPHGGEIADVQNL